MLATTLASEPNALRMPYLNPSLLPRHVLAFTICWVYIRYVNISDDFATFFVDMLLFAVPWLQTLYLGWSTACTCTDISEGGRDKERERETETETKAKQSAAEQKTYTFT